jgi:uncharacterized protein YbaR (Trm112 family)
MKLFSKQFGGIRSTSGRTSSAPAAVDPFLRNVLCCPFTKQHPLGYAERGQERFLVSDEVGVRWRIHGDSGIVNMLPSDAKTTADAEP